MHYKHRVSGTGCQVIILGPSTGSGSFPAYSYQISRVQVAPSPPLLERSANYEIQESFGDSSIVRIRLPLFSKIT